MVAPGITSPNNATFTVGSAGSFLVTTTGVPVVGSFTLAGLPGGLGLVNNNNGTATLSGTPAAGTNGICNLQIIASNGIAPDAVQNFTLTINGANVTSKVRVLWPASYTSLGNKQYRGVFTITNLGTQTLTNVKLSWPALPPGVTLVSATPVASLAPGKSATVVVVFQNLSNYALGNLKFYFPPQVLAG